MEAIGMVVLLRRAGGIAVPCGRPESYWSRRSSDPMRNAGGRTGSCEILDELEWLNRFLKLVNLPT